MEIKDRRLRRLAHYFPEIEAFPDQAAAKKAMRAWNRRLALNPLVWIACPIYAVFVVGLLFLADTLFSVLMPDAPAVAAALSNAVFFCVAFLVPRVAYQQTLRQYLREELLRAGVVICAGCGYDLRGQTEARCPECGKLFDRSLLRSK